MKIWQPTESNIIPPQDFLLHSYPIPPHAVSELILPGRNLTPATNIPPVITPMRDGQVDKESIGRLVDHLRSLGTTHIFVMGETGEFRFLSNDQRLEALRYYREAAPEMVLIGNSTAETATKTMENLKALQEYGYDAAVIAPLWGDNRGVPSSISSENSLPYFIYNNPHITGQQNIEEDLIRSCKGNFLGLKDSSGDGSRLEGYIALGHECGFVVYQGDEKQVFDFLPRHVPEGQSGLRGSVASIGNINNLAASLFVPGALTSDLAFSQYFIDRCVPVYTSDRKAISASIKHILHSMGVLSSSEVAAGTTSLTSKQIKNLNQAFSFLKEQRGFPQAA